MSLLISVLKTFIPYFSKVSKVSERGKDQAFLKFRQAKSHQFRFFYYVLNFFPSRVNLKIVAGKQNAP